MNTSSRGRNAAYSDTDIIQAYYELSLERPGAEIDGGAVHWRLNKLTKRGGNPNTVSKRLMELQSMGALPASSDEDPLVQGIVRHCAELAQNLRQYVEKPLRMEFEQEVKPLKEQLTQTESTIETLRAENAGYQQQLAEQQTTIQQLTDQIAERQAHEELLTENLTKAEQTEASLAQQLGKLEAQREADHRFIESLERNLDHNRKQASIDKAEIMAQANGKISEYKTQADNLRSELDAQRRELIEQQATERQLRGELNAQRREISERQATEKQLHEELTSLSGLSNINAQLKAQIEALQVNHNAKTAELLDAREHIVQLEKGSHINMLAQPLKKAIRDGRVSAESVKASGNRHIRYIINDTGAIGFLVNDLNMIWDATRDGKGTITTNLKSMLSHLTENDSKPKN